MTNISINATGYDYSPIAKGTKAFYVIKTNLASSIFLADEIVINELNNFGLFTGRRCRLKVTYVLGSDYCPGLKEGFSIIGFKVLEAIDESGKS
jgi:hypothetical protein